MRMNWKTWVVLGVLVFVAVHIGIRVGGSTVGSITIQGTVPNVVTISIVPQAGYNTLDLSQVVADLHVADVRELSNTTTGYKVTLASANAGQLKNGNKSALTYTAKYNGTPVTLSGTPVVVTNTSSSSSLVNILKQFVISYSGAASDAMLAGSYSDTLTFTITSN